MKDTAGCPAGSKLTGGGVELFQHEGQQGMITASRPNYNATEWEAEAVVTFANGGVGLIGVRAWAVCAK